MIGYPVINGKLKFVQTTEYAGDCTCCWDIAFNDNQEHTIKEFLDEILENHSGDWGDMSIRIGDCCYHYVVEYWHGEIRKCNDEVFNKFIDKPIRKIRANGGWTCMSYDIYY